MRYIDLFSAETLSFWVNPPHPILGQSPKLVTFSYASISALCTVGRFVTWQSLKLS